MKLGSELQVYNPIAGPLSKVTTIAQLEETFKTSMEVVENLDDAALSQLAGGNEADIDNVLNTILEETYSVLYGTKNLIKETNSKYIESLTDSLEEAMRKSSLNYFITSVLQEFQVNWHHLEWGQFVEQYSKLCVIAPRDHGKTFFFSHAYPIWKMYRYGGRKNLVGRNVNDMLNYRGFIITNEMNLAEELLEQIKITVEENDILRERLHPSRPDWWAKTSIRCKNGARLGLKSYGSSFRGRHPSYIIVDDFLKDNVIYSEIQRRKATDYFHSVIMNAIIPKGQVIVVGTPFHAADLYGDLKDKRTTNGWRVFEYPAITTTGKVLWADRYSYEDLMEKRATQGNIIFSRESLCRPIVSDASIFPWHILKRSLVGMEQYKLVKDIDSFPKKFSRVITGCDLALSAEVGADYSVYSTWGIDDTAKEMWLLHLWRGKGKSYQQQISIIKAIHRNFRSDLIVIEANQFQKMFAEMVADHDLPVVPHTTTAANKNDLENGLPGMSLFFERGKIHFPYGDQHSKDVADMVLAEFSTVAWTDNGIQGIGEHDDCVMSTWLGKRGLEFSGGGQFGMSFLE